MIYVAKERKQDGREHQQHICRDRAKPLLHKNFPLLWIMGDPGSTVAKVRLTLDLSLGFTSGIRSTGGHRAFFSWRQFPLFDLISLMYVKG